jgi:Protein of unknown function (DUF3592)
VVNPTDDRRGALQLIGTACLIVCVLFAIFSIPFFWGQIRVLRSWPVRQAVVTRSAVVATPSGQHGQLYSAQIEIAYAIDGQLVTTELTSFQSNNYDETVQRAAEFSVGSRRAVRYDPAQPKHVRVDASWNRRFFAVPLITLGCGVFFGLLAVGFFAAARARNSIGAEAH